MADQRSIELEIEVAGTPEEVWRAVATGPGISSWYVPHVVDERSGGTATASFGAGPEMQIRGRVATWEPPKRIVFDGGEGVEGLAFEWVVEAYGEGSCTVRLVNSGFGTGEQWDSQYDAMIGGWQLFMMNLKLHLEHFGGQTATPVMPTARWAGPPAAAWATLTAALGIPAVSAVGDRLEVAAIDDESAEPALAGTVADVAPTRLSLVIDQPVPGTAVLAVEGTGEVVSVSIWSYLYGDDGPSVAARDLPRWQQWLDERKAGDDGDA